MRSISTFLGSVLLVFVLSSPLFAQPTGAQAAAVRHAQAIAGFITSGDRAGYTKFVEANFGAELMKMPVQRHLNFISALHDQTRGFEVGDVQDWNTNEVVVLVKSKLTGAWDGLLVRVEPETYKIAGIGLRPPKKAPVESKRLTTKEISTELDAFTKKLADADVFSGAVLLAKDGQVIYKGAFGMANKDFGAPNRTNTKFNLGSMNKMFTGVAIA